MKEKIAELRGLGRSYKEISAELDCSESTVGYWVRKSKLPFVSKTRSSNHFAKEELELAVNDVKCWSDLCKALGKTRTASLHIALRSLVEEYDIDVSHFLYPDPRVSPATRRQKGGRTLEQMCASRSTKSTDLRKKLISEGVKKEECEHCKGTRWMGEPIPLELDHIDGDHGNNDLANLRILCYNCHGLTPTHRVPFRLRKALP